MNQSDEEEDFHSADEAGFDEEEEQAFTNNSQKPKQQQQQHSQQQKHKDGAKDKGEKQCNEKVINKKKVDETSEQKPTVDYNSRREHHSAEISNESSLLAQQDDSQREEPSKEPSGPCRSRDEDETEAAEAEVNDGEEEEEDDEEEILAERIRERNLKIARKFSAEIARSLSRASAPIPVKTPNNSTHRDFPEIPDSIDRKSSIHQPPAPPSTPALSSSFNNCSDPTTAQQTAGTPPPTLSTQYSWRIPPKVATQQSSSGSSTPSKNIKAEDQARQVLDRLTESLSQTDKNLFERVAADIKKVSIKNEEVSPTTTTTDATSALTSITDLGSALGGWGWSGATKLLSSASQVTSQVGSVLDSVVGVSAPDVPHSPPSSCAQDETGSSAPNTQANKTKPSDTRPEQVSTEVTYNDPLVDLTLNAMESIGKKAFEVMTTRDETGSLQIKGLGRPWEHLLNARKVDHSSQVAGNVQGKEEEVEVEEHRRSSSPPPEDLDQIEETFDSSSASKIRSDSPPVSSSLKLRKRRLD